MAPVWLRLLGKSTPSITQQMTQSRSVFNQFLLSFLSLPASLNVTISHVHYEWDLFSLVLPSWKLVDGVKIR